MIRPATPSTDRHSHADGAHETTRAVRQFGRGRVVHTPDSNAVDALSTRRNDNKRQPRSVDKSSQRASTDLACSPHVHCVDEGRRPCEAGTARSDGSWIAARREGTRCARCGCCVAPATTAARDWLDQPEWPEESHTNGDQSCAAWPRCRSMCAAVRRVGILPTRPARRSTRRHNLRRCCKK